MRAREDEFLDWRIFELARGNVGSICSGRQMRKPENVKNEFLIFFENRDFCFFEISKFQPSRKIQKRIQKNLIVKIKKVDGPKKCTLYKEAKKKLYPFSKNTKTNSKKINRKNKEG